MERKGVIVARRIIIAVSVSFALALIAYGVAIVITARAAVTAYVNAYQRDDPQIATLGNPTQSMFAKIEDRPIPEDERFLRCLHGTSTWTIEDPSVFALGASCATVKATCERDYHGVVDLEQLSNFRWYVLSIRRGRCK